MQQGARKNHRERAAAAQQQREQDVVVPQVPISSRSEVSKKAGNKSPFRTSCESQKTLGMSLQIQYSLLDVMHKVIFAMFLVGCLFNVSFHCLQFTNESLFTLYWSVVYIVVRFISPSTLLGGLAFLSSLCNFSQFSTRFLKS